MSTEPNTEKVLGEIRAAIDAIARASRVIIVHPDHESDVRRAVTESPPFPGLLEVVSSEYVPRDRVFLIPKHTALLDGDDA